MKSRPGVPALAVILAVCGGCSRPAPDSSATPVPDFASASAGEPKVGPGDLVNTCERIWCLDHAANFDLPHFLEGHDGWILHEDGRGDVFAPRFRSQGPEMKGARASALNLCGRHVHPWMLGPGGGPFKRTGWNAALTYSRGHFRAFGTRLAPCCENGLGWAFVHASRPREFRFHDTALYRELTGAGWQAPIRPRRRS